MKTAPTLHTDRLILRSLMLEDAQDIQRLAGAREVASTLSNMPHPYEDGMAEEWIHSSCEKFEKDEAVTFAITLKTDSSFIGGIDIRPEQKNENGELGYWIGKPYWGNGYATEAAKAVVTHGFEALKLNRIYAYYVRRNLASERVLEKIGMRYEGCQRQHIKKWNNFEDRMACGMLKADYDLLLPNASNEQR